MPHSSADFRLLAKLDPSDKCDFLVLGTYFGSGGSENPKSPVTLPGGLMAHIAEQFEQGNIGSDMGSTLIVHDPKGTHAKRLLLFHFGQVSRGVVTPLQFHKACLAVSQELAGFACSRIVSALPLVKVQGRDLPWAMRLFAHHALHARYRFDDFLSDKPKRLPAATFTLAGPAGLRSAETTRLRRALREAKAVAQGESLCRDLANTPPNVCTPDYIARKARALARQLPELRCEILDEKRLAREKMNSMLAVAAGSQNKPRLALLHYHPRGARGKPVALVGKGITFDTGGISIKPSQAMDEMKFDMCGAASVMGTMRAIAEMGIKRHVIGALVLAENMPDAKASRPGDIVRSRAGHTIEILNTDAEGRLILCDALDYIRRYEPSAVIDIATLTGACVIALGKVCSGLMTNDQQLGDELLRAGEDANDAAWQLPLTEEYSEQLYSPTADFANIGGREAGTVTAACFLWNFMRDCRWAHLDIAGTAWLGPPHRVATGRPVPLLCQYLINAGAG